MGKVQAVALLAVLIVLVAAALWYRTLFSTPVVVAPEMIATMPGRDGWRPFNPSISPNGEMAYRLSPFSYRHVAPRMFGAHFMENTVCVFRDRDGHETVVPQVEDMRLFHMSGQIAGLYSRMLSLNVVLGITRNQMCMCRFAPFRELRLVYDRANAVEKNWMPFEHNGRLHVTYSVNPHVVLTVNTATGQCADAHVTWSGEFTRPGALRGGSPWVRIATADGPMCLSVVHWTRRVMGYRKYFHAFALMRLSPPFPIVHIGQDFRFQQVFGDTRDFVQFCSGLALADDRTLVLSYGVADCEACLASVDLDSVLASAGLEAVRTVQQ